MSHGTPFTEPSIMELIPVSLDTLSDIRYSVSLAPHETFTQPEFLHVAFRGVYRDGSMGKSDATYIMAIMEALDRAWYSKAFIIDLTELTYNWGDEMSWLWDIGWQKWCRCQRPLAVVIGVKCREALQTLDPDEFGKYAVESFNDALSLIRQQKPGYEVCVAAFRKANKSL